MFFSNGSESLSLSKAESGLKRFSVLTKHCRLLRKPRVTALYGNLEETLVYLLRKAESNNELAENAWEGVWDIHLVIWSDAGYSEGTLAPKPMIRVFTSVV